MGGRQRDLASTVASPWKAVQVRVLVLLRVAAGRSRAGLWSGRKIRIVRTAPAWAWGALPAPVLVPASLVRLWDGGWLLNVAELWAARPPRDPERAGPSPLAARGW